MDKSSEDDQVPLPTTDETYEVRRTQPQHGDSYIGSLDILTVHRMLEEQNANIKEKR